MTIRPLLIFEKICYVLGVLVLILGFAEFFSLVVTDLDAFSVFLTEILKAFAFFGMGLFFSALNEIGDYLEELVNNQKKKNPE